MFAFFRIQREELKFLSEMKIHEKAYRDYVAGKKYLDIAKKYDVSLNTVKTWKRRHGWVREPNVKSVQKKVVTQKRVQPIKIKQTSQLESEIERDLLQQLKRNSTHEKRYIDLVSDYMSLWRIKNQLILDIEKRGVQVLSFNAKGQEILKKNDSVAELLKCNAQMLKLLVELGLSAIKNVGDDDDL